ncbi:MAG: alpha-galactosidase, partial [Dysgonamonadaceae bacterium]|nr:alpha-galactosidase [Dysgonamonadaceae bacterium]
DYIHGKGLKAGIYSEAGKNTCAYKWDNDKVNGLNVGFYGYEQSDAKQYFNTWGYDFIKVDYCGAEDQQLDEKTQYMKILNAISEAEDPKRPEKVRFNICRWMFPGTWVTEITDRPVSWRISHDIRNNFNKTLGVRDVFEHNLYLSAYASPGHFNDMDMMQLGRNTLTVDQEKSHFGLWCIMSSPLMIGCDLRTIPQSTLDIITNKEVIAVNQDLLGLQAQVVSRDGRKYVMAKMIEEDQGKVRAVALFNGTTSPASMTIHFKDIQLSDKAYIRDLWAKSDLGEFDKSCTVTVPANGTAILRIEGVSSFDKTEFEGEDAFINKYSGIAVKNNRYNAAVFSPRFGASGNYVLTNPGGADNWAEFRRVYSTSGGKYKLKLFYYSEEERDLTVTVNGVEYLMNRLNSGAGKRGRAFIDEIELQQGYNTIRLSNENGPAPDIDKFVLLDPNDPGDDKEPDLEANYGVMETPNEISNII